MEIRDGEPQTVAVALVAGQYARVVFQWSGIDLSVDVVKPDGIRLTELSSQIVAPGPASVSVIADEAGEYRFEVRPQEKWKVNGVVDMRLAFVGDPGTADRARVAAERALAESAQLAGSDAAGKIKQALEYWREAGDREGEAAALHALADLYKVARNLEDAKDNYEKEQALRRELGDLVGEAYTFVGLGDAYRRSLSPEAAIPYYEQALALFRQARNRTGESTALYLVGFSLMSASRYRESLEFHADALAIQRADGDRVGEGRTLNAMGGANDRLGNYAEALNYYQQAVDIRQELGDHLGVALIASNNIGIIHDNAGDWQRAKESYEAALTTYGSLLDGGLRTCSETDVAGQAARVCDYATAALENLGEVYNTMGDPEAAQAKFEESLAISTKRGDIRRQSAANARICYSLLLQGRPQDALVWCDKVLPARTPQTDLSSPEQRKPGVDPDVLGYTYIVAGMVHDELGDPSTASVYFAEALKIHQESGDPRGQALALEKAGEALVHAGDAEGALGKLGDALVLWRSIDDRDGEAITLYQMARASRDRGDLPTAHARVMEAIDLIESLRVRITAQRLRASYFGAKADYYELAVDLKMQLAKAGGLGVATPAELVASALQTSERARARVLLDILSEAMVEPTAGSDPKLDELFLRRRELQRQLNLKAALQTTLLAQKAPAEQLVSVEKDVSGLAAEYDDVDAQTRARSTRYAGLTSVPSLGVAEIQSELLDEQTTLLEYALGEKRSYLWVVARSGIRSYELRGSAEIEASARRVGEILVQQQRNPGELAEAYETRLAELQSRFLEESTLLSGMLLGPAAADLGRQRLLVVAPGGLQQIPFAALPSPSPTAAATSRTNATDGIAAASPPLGQDHEIVSLPSASTLAALRTEAARRQPAPKAVAVLADPIFDRDDPRLQKALRGRPGRPENPRARGDATRSFGANLPRLLSSRREAKAIVSAAPAKSAIAALDFKANRSTATSSQLGQYRIVHFATHGIFNDRQPELSGVVLSLFDERGQPQEDGFLRLHDIYNLSLPVDMVVLSACQTGLGKQVRGEGLIGLTRGFMYAGASRVLASLWKVDDDATAELMKVFYLHIFRDGMSPPAALRQAQMSVRSQPRWSAPYYWAGFVLQGEWK